MTTTRSTIAVVTGSNRGIGRQVAIDLANRGFFVFAGARDPSQVPAMDGITGIRLDVENDDDIQALVRAVDERGGCDVLVNNAGIFPERSEDALTVSLDAMRRALEVNTLAPLRMTQALAPALRRRHGRVVNVSSGMGQLGEMGGGSPAYRVSKTALHAVTVQLAQALAGDGVLVNAICPGWVKTDMGGDSAPRTVEQGSASVLFAALLPEGGQSGRLFRDGVLLDW